MNHHDPKHDDRVTTTNYWKQAMAMSTGHGKSVDFWRELMARFGGRDDVVIHVIDLKKTDELIEFYEEHPETRDLEDLNDVIRAGRRGDVMLDHDPRDHIQYATLEALEAAHGRNREILKRRLFMQAYDGGLDKDPVATDEPE